jgi:hypothetical protein
MAILTPCGLETILQLGELPHQERWICDSSILAEALCCTQAFLAIAKQPKSMSMGFHHQPTAVHLYSVLPSKS